MKHTLKAAALALLLSTPGMAQPLPTTWTSGQTITSAWANSIGTLVNSLNTTVSALNTTGFSGVVVNLGATGSTTAGNNSIGGTTSGVEVNAVTGKVGLFKVNGVNQLTLGLGGLTAFGSGLGTVATGSIQIISAAANVLTLNVPTGGYYDFRVNNVAGVVVGPSSVSLGAAGTVTVGNQQIIGTSGGPVLNTPTGLIEDHQVNGVSQLQVGLGGIIAFGSGLGTVNNAAVQLISASTGNLSCNVPTGGVFNFRTNGVLGLQVSPCALALGAVGTVVNATPSLVGTSAGPVLNAASGTSSFFTVNGTTYASLGSSGLALDNALPLTPTICMKVGPVAATQTITNNTAMAIPGLTTTARGRLTVLSSDGTHGEFMLDLGSTTPVLLSGSATVQAGAPGVGNWSVQYSSGWQIYNNTAGALNYREFLIGG